jgi:hypothetical protein
MDFEEYLLISLDFQDARELAVSLKELKISITVNH